jgi:phosphate uptake regulator
METRKVVKTGGTTLIISLPKDWVNQVGIKPGDDLEIFQQVDGTLLLDPAKKAREEKTSAELDIEEYDSFDDLRRSIFAKYLQGYSELVLKSKKPISSRRIKECRDLLQGLTGLEMVDTTENSMVIRDLLNPMELSLKKALNRACTLVKLMVRNTVKAFQEGDEEIAREVIYWGNEVEKFYLLIYRQIKMASRNLKLAKSIGIGEDIYPLYIYSIVKYAKEISVLLSDIMEIFLEMDERSRGNVAKLWSSLGELGEAAPMDFDLVIKAALVKNEKLANQTLKKTNEMRQKLVAVKNLYRESAKKEKGTYEVLDKIEGVVKLSQKILEEVTLNT